MNWPICSSCLVLCRITAGSALVFANRGASADDWCCTKLRKPRRRGGGSSRMVCGVELSSSCSWFVEVGAKGSGLGLGRCHTPEAVAWRCSSSHKWWGGSGALGI